MRITFKMLKWFPPLRTVLALVLCLAAEAGATVFYSRDEAHHLAFPEADRTEARDFFLTPEQRTAIEKAARAPLESDLLTVYVGYAGDRVLGYAIFDTHVVRTLPETFLAVLTPDGAVTATYVIAFYEPLDYLPSDRWLRQVQGKRNGDDLQIGRGIAGITGSTLSSQAIMGGIRRALAIHAVLLAHP
jgi:hypothetical protein